MMNLTGDFLRGHTDAVILAILAQGDNYGYRINQTIDEVSKGEFKLTEATLYTSFKRLESAGYIISYWQEVDMRKRKYYSITELGLKYLEDHTQGYFKMRNILDQFYGGKL